MEGTRKREFTLLEIDDHKMYEVSWNNKEGEPQKEDFDNYIDAFMQYEHLGNMKIKAVLKLTLLPLPKLKGELNAK